MIGKVLKYMRIKKGLNQEQLAKIINVERTTLSGYETERRDINFKTMEQIANNCGFKIYFDNGKEKFQAKDLERKDL